MLQATASEGRRDQHCTTTAHRFGPRTPPARSVSNENRPADTPIAFTRRHQPSAFAHGRESRGDPIAAMIPPRTWLAEGMADRSPERTLTRQNQRASHPRVPHHRQRSPTRCRLPRPRYRLPGPASQRPERVTRRTRIRSPHFRTGRSARPSAPSRRVPGGRPGRWRAERPRAGTAHRPTARSR